MGNKIMPEAETDSEQPAVRDRLAYDRTELANERTLLAYLRTAIALCVSGGVLLKFFSELAVWRYSGLILLATGGFAIVFGVWRFVSFRNKLRRICLKKENV